MHALGEGVSIRDRDFRILHQNQINIDALGDHTGEVMLSGPPRPGAGV